MNGLHGLIIINKPPGVTSFSVVKRVKKTLQVRKAGHAGTLDPFARGVLMVCLNEGTKLVPFLMEEEKEYQAMLRLGVETDTQDITGRVLKENPCQGLAVSDIEKAFQGFQGEIMQTPPMYSALKHKGVPLYQFARQGKEIERPQRAVEVKELAIVTVDLPRVFFRVVCSKGTYIRTLASDVGNRLGCGACLEELTRTRSGRFRLENALSLEELEKLSQQAIKDEWVVSPARALASLPEIMVDEEVSQKVFQGKTITWAEFQEKMPAKVEGKIKIIGQRGDLLAVGEILNPSDPGPETPVWKLLRVFNCGLQKSSGKKVF